MNTNELYEGEPIKIKGREYIIPGLSFGQIESMSDTIARVQTKGDSDKLDKETIHDMIEIVSAAMKRNYPELTAAEVKEMIDTRNIKQIFFAIMGASGFNQVNAIQGEIKPVV